jgi:hypothetical protein
VADVRNNDDDIDALMGSVVGRNGEIVEFPATPAQRDRVKRNASVAELSRALTETLEASENEAAEPRESVDPRTVPVRFSNLKHIARSPLHYWDAVQLGRDDTLAMRLGRGAHALTFGMPAIAFPGKKRAGKQWDAFSALHADKEILSRSEWAKSTAVANAIRRHPLASQLLLDGTTVEETIEWEWLGRKCTSRPDSRRGSSVVVDLKTTQCAEPTSSNAMRCTAVTTLSWCSTAWPSNT